MEGESRRGREETRQAESSSLPRRSARRRRSRSVDNDRRSQAESSSLGRSISNPSSLPRGRSIANPSSLPRRSARRRRSRSRSVDNDRRSPAESSSRRRSILNPSCLARLTRRSRSRSVDNDRSSVESDRNRSGIQDNDRRRRSGTLDHDRRSNRSSSRGDGTIISSNQPSSVDGTIIGSNQTNGDNDVSSMRRLTARMSVPLWEYINPSANPATVTQRDYIVSDNAGIEGRRTLQQRRQEFIFEEAQILELAEHLIMITDYQPILPADRAAVQQLPRVIISVEHINNNNDNSTCPICWEKYQVGEEARVMGCGHMYHKACIFEWLENQRTCPLCRFAMPYAA